MNRLWTLALVMALLVGSAWAQGGTSVVRKVDPTAGTLVIEVPSGEQVQARDIFVVSRKGKTLGECMVISVKGTEAVLIPKASFKGTPKVGDQAMFDRHVDAPPDDTAGWIEFKSPQCGFAVMVPSDMGAPATRQEQTQSGPVTTRRFQCLDTSQGMVYQVSRHDYTLNKAGAGTYYLGDEAQMEHFVKQVVADTGGSLLWKREARIGGHSAREFEIALPRDKGYVVKGKVMMIGNVAWWIMVFAERKGTSSNAVKFLNSFRLLDKSS